MSGQSHTKKNIMSKPDRVSCAAPVLTITSLTPQAPSGLSSASPHRRDFMDTPRGPEGMAGGSASSTSSSSTVSTLSSSSSSSSYTPAVSRPEEGPKEKQESPDAEYLSSRCVLFTYYQGDISSVVDEHFSRALSSYMDREGKRRAPDHQGTGRTRANM